MNIYKYLYIILLFLGVLFSPKYLYAQVSSRMDSLKNDLKTVKEAEKGQIYFKIANEFKKTNNLDSIWENLQKTEDIALKYKKYELQIDALIQKGLVFTRKNQPDKSLETFEKARVIAEFNKKEKQLADIYNALGIRNLHNGKYAISIKFLQKSLQIREKLKDNLGVAKSYLNIGAVYIAEKDLKTALEYLFKGYNLLDKENENDIKVRLECNIGHCYKELKEYEKAIPFYQRGLKMAEKRNLADMQGIALLGLGHISAYQKQPNQALEYYLQSVKIFEMHNQKPSLTYPLQGIARIYFNNGELEKSYEYSQKALKIAQELKIPAEAKDAYFSLYEITKKQGKSAEAIDYLENFRQIKDSLTNNEKTKQITRLETEFQVSKKEKEIEILGKDNQLLDNQNIIIKKEAESQRLFSLAERETNLRKSDSLQNLAQKALLKEQKVAAEAKAQKAVSEQEIAQKQNLVYLLGAFVAFFVVVVLLVMRNQNLQKKANKLLVAKNLEINQQKEEIQVQAETLVELNEWKDKIFSIIAHDLRSPMVSFQGVGRQIAHFLNKNRPEKVEELGFLIEKNAKDVGEILDNLLHWALLQKQEISITENSFLLYDFVQKMAVNEENVSISVPKDYTFRTDEAILAIIFRNILGNALKFTPENGKIAVFLEENNEEVALCVSNTGEGIPPEKLEMLFSYQVESKRGLHGEKGTGIGLMLCQAFAKRINAVISAQSIVGEKTTFSIRFHKKEKTLQKETKMLENSLNS